MGFAKLAAYGLTAASIGYWLLCLAGALTFLRRRHAPASDGAPPVTILKPVRGLDPGLEENCRTFLHQDYPSYQVIFGVAASDDPAIPLLRRALETPGGEQHRLVIGPDSYGPNRKLSLLHQMLPHAAHDIVIISDSDVRVGPDYLRHVAPPFLDPRVGLVTCLYRAEDAAGFAAHLEAWAIQDTFAPAVMAAYATEGVTFAFGSTLAIRRQILDRAGGFGSFAHFLADDYQLAAEARRQGYRLVLADYPVACVLGRSRLGDVCDRLLRWARTHRACRPVGYFLSGISHGTVWSLLALLLGRFSPAALALAAGAIGVRATTAFFIDAAILRSRDPAARLWLLLPGDLLTFTAWALSFSGNRVRWRGTRYRVVKGGRLLVLGEAECARTSR
jgi:ceramide glucosyltransferase